MASCCTDRMCHVRVLIFACCCIHLALLAASKRDSECFSFYFHVPTTASNDSGLLLPVATYKIHAQHCPPTKYVPGRSDCTVQLLVHGGNGNKNIWSAHGPVGSSKAYQPYNYSWVQFARGEGYHTVAIDRLGTGKSSHPNPEYVRFKVQVEILHTILLALRRGGVAATVPRFEKVIAVGHSVGSILLGLLLPRYPQTVNAAILTGFIPDFQAGLNNTAAGIRDQTPTPARDVLPQRFGNLDPGYAGPSSVDVIRYGFFSKDGDFDPALPRILYDTVDVQASGEKKSIVAVALETPNIADLLNISGSGFKGDVALITGDSDTAFCNGNCGSGTDNYVTKGLEFYSSSPGCRFAYEIPHTGHMLVSHYSARKTYTIVHEWLALTGY